MSNLSVLSICIFLPLLSAIAIMFFTGSKKFLEINDKRYIRKQKYAKNIAVLSSILTLILSTYLLLNFDTTNANFQFIERYMWIDSIGLEFYVGIDSISIYFIFLTALLTLICIIFSIFTVENNLRGFLFCLLLIESFCIGVFSSLNLLLFYIFFEAILIPIYLIIGIWGGNNRIYATIKFFLYTFFGSVFLLISLIYINTEAITLNITELVKIIPNYSFEIQKYLWFATFIAFAVKVPMIPFHTWLPNAHVEAPTAGSVILAGILLKLGAYGFIRISLPLFPLASEYFATYVLWLSGFAIIYTSFVALAQTDIKKMIAYSSVAHMGYVTAGIFSLTNNGISGAIFQMISHGLISSALFLIIGMLYNRHKTREISKYGGVAESMPILATFFMIAMLGSIALPSLSGFIGEFFTIVGVFEVNPMIAIISSFGVVLGALYMLKLYKSIMFGKAVQTTVGKFQDLQLYEVITISPLIVLIIYLGIQPNIIMRAINISIQTLLTLSYG